MLTYFNWTLRHKLQWNLNRNSNMCLKKKMCLKMLSGKWWPFCLSLNVLTHWGRVTHICVSKITIIGSDYGLSPGRRQAIIWTNAGILLISNLGTNFNEILSKIHTFSFKEMHLKMLSAQWRLFRLGLNELTNKQAHLLMYNMSTDWMHDTPPLYWIGYNNIYATIWT